MRLSKILLLLCLVGCKDEPVNIVFPDGGYEYLSNPDEYVDFHYSPVKDSISKEDSIEIAFYTKYFYTSFNERNLSLRPTDKSTWKIIY